MKIVLIIIAVIIIGIVLLLGRSGLFVKPKVMQKDIDDLHIFYLDHIGPYQETGKIQNEMYEYLLTNYQIQTTMGIGIYYDNPQKVPKEQLRSKAGCIVEERDLEKLADVHKKYKFMTIEKQEMIYAEFPFNNKFSIFLGIMKVYPLMKKYCDEKGYMFRESIEIYDVPEKKIIYLMQMD